MPEGIQNASFTKEEKKTHSKDFEKQIFSVLWGKKLQFVNKEWKEEKCGFYAEKQNSRYPVSNSCAKPAVLGDLGPII